MSNFDKDKDIDNALETIFDKIKPAIKEKLNDEGENNESNKLTTYKELKASKLYTNDTLLKNIKKYFPSTSDGLNYIVPELFQIIDIISMSNIIYQDTNEHLVNMLLDNILFSELKKIDSKVNTFYTSIDEKLESSKSDSQPEPDKDKSYKSMNIAYNSREKKFTVTYPDFLTDAFETIKNKLLNNTEYAKMISMELIEQATPGENSVENHSDAHGDIPGPPTPPAEAQAEAQPPTDEQRRSPPGASLPPPAATGTQGLKQGTPPPPRAPAGAPAGAPAEAPPAETIKSRPLAILPKPPLQSPQAKASAKAPATAIEKITDLFGKDAAGFLNLLDLPPTDEQRRSPPGASLPPPAATGTQGLKQGTPPPPRANTGAPLPPPAATGTQGLTQEVEARQQLLQLSKSSPITNYGAPIRNNGGTCWLNSAIQLLWNIDSVRNFLINSSESKLTNLLTLDSHPGKRQKLITYITNKYDKAIRELWEERIRANLPVKKDATLEELKEAKDKALAEVAIFEDEVDIFREAPEIGMLRKEIDIDTIKALRILFLTINDNNTKHGTYPLNIKEIMFKKTNNDEVTVARQLHDRFTEQNKAHPSETDTAVNRYTTQEDTSEFLIMMTSIFKYYMNIEILTMCKSYTTIHSTTSVAINNTESKANISTFPILQLSIDSKIVKTSISNLITDYQKNDVIVDNVTDYVDSLKQSDKDYDQAMDYKTQSKITKVSNFDESTYLIINIVRFISSYDKSTNTMIASKVNTTVEPEKNLLFSGKTYTLQGCIIHIGNSMAEGHYIYIVYNMDGEPIQIIDDETIYTKANKIKAKYEYHLDLIPTNGVVFLYKNLTKIQDIADAAETLAKPFIDHAVIRVNQLIYQLAYNNEAHVVIPGSTSNEKHNLGTGLAKDQWIEYYIKNGNHPINVIISAQRLFVEKLGDFFKSLKTRFNKRVLYVSEVNNSIANKNNIVVWGANSENCYGNAGEAIDGEGQASKMIAHGPGVFGIITTPLTGLPDEEKSRGFATGSSLTSEQPALPREQESGVQESRAPSRGQKPRTLAPAPATAAAAAPALAPPRTPALAEATAIAAAAAAAPLRAQKPRTPALERHGAARAAPAPAEATAIAAAAIAAPPRTPAAAATARGQEPITPAPALTAAQKKAIAISTEEEHMEHADNAFRNQRKQRWFTDIFGVDERIKWDDVVSNFKMENDTLICTSDLLTDPAYKEQFVGKFECLSLKELKMEHSKYTMTADSLRISFDIVATGTGVGPLHMNTDNNGAVFQVASQFNCLEMYNHYFTPNHGVGVYINDRTQGPACAMACPAALVYRNYLVKHSKNRVKPNNTTDKAVYIGQNIVQIDNLSNLGTIVGNNTMPDGKYWTMKNGYAFLKSRDSLLELNRELATEGKINDAMDELCVGVHWKTSVRPNSNPNTNKVCQVYASALPINYNNNLFIRDDIPVPSPDEWRTFASAILKASYEATLAVAAIKLKEDNLDRIKCFITLIGGGAFENDRLWIQEALYQAINKYKYWPIDVILVHYGAKVSRDISNAFPKFRAGETPAIPTTPAAAATPTPAIVKTPTPATVILNISDYGVSFPDPFPDKKQDRARYKRQLILQDTLDRFAENTQFYTDRAIENLTSWEQKKITPRSCILNVTISDWGTKAQEVTKKYGTTFACLNMASKNPGGHYMGGATAQEENMFRRTNCHFSLVPNTEFFTTSRTYTAAMIDLITGKNNKVYIDITNPRICIKSEEIFLNGHVSGYTHFKDHEIFQFYEMRSAAINITREGKGLFNEDEMTTRIHAQIQTLIDYKIRHVVFGAFGCGAFHNPPERIACIYRDKLKTVDKDFDVIEFPIFYAGHGDRNFNIFNKAFKVTAFTKQDGSIERSWRYNTTDFKVSHNIPENMGTIDYEIPYRYGGDSTSVMEASNITLIPADLDSKTDISEANKQNKRVFIMKQTLERFASEGTNLFRSAQKNLEKWITEAKSNQKPNLLSVENRDWGDAALEYTIKYGVIFACLNMANAYTPGGGYIKGSGAQEENMFRRTNCHFTIDSTHLVPINTDQEWQKRQYAPEKIDLLKGKDGYVYFDWEYPRICIRGPEENSISLGYDFLDDGKIFPFYELRSAALDRRKDGKPPKQLKMADWEIRKMKYRINAQLETLRVHDVKHVILGAFGCGAFYNDPETIAELYKQAIEERKAYFEVIVFAIIHETPNTNFEKFKEVFETNPLIIGASASASPSASASTTTDNLAPPVNAPTPPTSAKPALKLAIPTTPATPAIPIKPLKLPIQTRKVRFKPNIKEEFSIPVGKLLKTDFYSPRTERLNRDEVKALESHRFLRRDTDKHRPSDYFHDNDEAAAAVMIERHSRVDYDFLRGVKQNLYSLMKTNQNQLSDDRLNFLLKIILFLQDNDIIDRADKMLKGTMARDDTTLDKAKVKLNARVKAAEADSEEQELFDKIVEDQLSRLEH